jgi:hypothetical protein
VTVRVRGFTGLSFLLIALAIGSTEGDNRSANRRSRCGKVPVKPPQP